jgi:hypothetical protein
VIGALDHIDKVRDLGVAAIYARIDAEPKIRIWFFTYERAHRFDGFVAPVRNAADDLQGKGVILLAETFEPALQPGFRPAERHEDGDGVIVSLS